MKHRNPDVEAVAAWADLRLGRSQWELLQRYVDWLLTEGIASGGLGPDEGDVVWNRHIADSLTFFEAAAGGGSVVDIGSGVGLPAIPLAIAYPDTQFVAVDKSGRRADLLGRVVRILDLSNVAVLQSDVDSIDQHFHGLTARAVAPLEITIGWAERLLAPGGTGVVAISRRLDTASVPGSDKLATSLITPPTMLLDHPLVLLRMIRRVDR